MNRSDCLCWRILLIVSLILLPILPHLQAADSGASVVVIYNTREPESRRVAEYYAQRRQVPSNQLFGFDLPLTESMTRVEFMEQLQKPLLKNLEANKLFTFAPVTNGVSAARTAAQRRVVEATIRYAALCYGVPTKILRDPNLVEEGVDKLRPELRRNEASVDSQLACLPLSEQTLMWTGPLPNRFYGATNSTGLHPTNGILMVTRLDGPSASIARGLVDKALEAETNGLWGRAYFDSLGITNATTEYKLGDDWIRGGAQTCRRLGFETELDQRPGFFPSDSKNSGTFPASYPMSHIAFYAGWYDWHVSGPFTQPAVEFMPGAFAYHLHSFSAQTLRTTNEHWVGPLLAKGATITMGSVDEPYLMGTPDVAAFLAQLIYMQFSFGEAAYASQNSLSWQNIAVGDPLYRPFGRKPQDQHLDLERRQSKLIEWSHLRVVNLNQAMGADPDELIGYLEQMPLTRKSAVLREKLADLYWAKKKFSDALEFYDATLKLDPSPQQKIRIMLKLAERRAFFGPEQAAFNLYQKFLNDFPDYPDLLSIYQKLLPLAQKLAKKEEVERCEREIKRLAPPPPATKS
jgi:uncharacterized protein (TIGR03790 family)